MGQRKQHFLQKLYSREIHGSFKRGHPVHNRPLMLFGRIPEKFTFPLRNVISQKHHIMMGMTRCGQFLMTYTFSADLRLSVHFHFRYRLHWWSYRPGHACHKVAEVQLFDNNSIQCALRVGVAEWPNINDRLIVYGYSGDECDSLSDLEDNGLCSRKYYITVTTKPSLHDCRDCKTVAESFDEEDMAANWDRAISLSCLKHGLTIHAIVDIAPPYPSFDPLINLKIDNKIIINTGNFLHVLSFGLDKEKIPPSKNDSIVPGEICHKIGEMLSYDLKGYNCPWKSLDNSSCLPVQKLLPSPFNKAWLSSIMDKAEKVYAFEESDDDCEPRFKWFKKRRLAEKMYEFCSDDDGDMENRRPTDRSRQEESCVNSSSRLERQTARSRIPKAVKKNVDLEKSRALEIPYKGIFFSTPDPLVIHTNTVYDVVPGNDLSRFISKKCSNQNNKTLEIIVPYEVNKNISGPQQNLVDSVNCKSDCDDSNKCFSNISHNSSMFSTSETKAVQSESDNHQIITPNMPRINPDLSSMLAEWEVESWSSVSPRSDSSFHKKDETKNDIIQSFMELIPETTSPPRSSSRTASENISVRLNESAPTANRVSSPNSSMNVYSPPMVVLKPRNCNLDKEPQKKKEQDDKWKGFAKEDIAPRVKSAKEADINRQRIISGCSLRFNRTYIEVDEEIISTITDIEDDDQGTGYHWALPLSVHGSAYAQLQMVSSQKAEKMSIHCEHVNQTSLDIEQFCFKAADIICECEGFKFWFCNDYDVEIIDVCAFNGDILGVVCMRVNAEKSTQCEKYSAPINQRFFCDMSCVFVWNPSLDRCWLEAYSNLVDVTRRVNNHWGQTARREAKRLRHYLQSSTLFTLPPYPHIRNFEHRMWTDEKPNPSVDEIRDYTNLIGFRLFRNRSPNGIIVEFGLD